MTEWIQPLFFASPFCIYFMRKRICGRLLTSITISAVFILLAVASIKYTYDFGDYQDYVNILTIGSAIGVAMVLILAGDAVHKGSKDVK